MKLVAALIRPFKLDEVRRAVADLGLQGVTVTEVQVHGEAERWEFYRGAEYPIDFAPQTKIELAVDDSIVEPVIEAICNVTRTGRRGDGGIYVSDLEQVVRIRTAETGSAAL